jgi:hypothetical protein
MFQFKTAHSSTFNPALRGYHAVYRENEVNHCPGCGRTHWMIGRMLAECSFCATALPLSDSYARGTATPVVMHGRSRPQFTARFAA